ncbi:hypothetical protein FOPG_06667 [Fusarium oxysporum f. sp. conglutinans race 2 54008]|uniref:Uncharacterized protein n=1 Tax=Fusarium oxysporum f. sp. conglutinans race 2 54008 TaxID=1089457 RepID=X0HSE9_FUSOX|nr:hypothetical protein FOPG_06667 [Fusarium oxysporum f. sp. conglutinans race 2 54008]
MLQRAFDDGPGLVASMGYSDIWPVATSMFGKGLDLQQLETVL